MCVSPDNNGNCTAVTAGGLTTSLAYDYENRVTQLTYSNSSTNTFTYNAANLRLKKVDSTGTQNYVTDGVSPASPVLQDSGATYTPGISERRGGASKYQHGDLTGNSRALSDSSQAVTDSWVYDGFGMVANRTGTTATPFGYGGGVQYQSDTQSGLMLLGNRYYDSSVGRFISRDPAKSGSNWFAYCGNNPLNRSDPSGLAYICDDGDLAAHGKGIAMPFDDGRDWLDNPGLFFGGTGDGAKKLARIARIALEWWLFGEPELEPELPGIQPPIYAPIGGSGGGGGGVPPVGRGGPYISPPSGAPIESPITGRPGTPFAGATGEPGTLPSRGTGSGAGMGAITTIGVGVGVAADGIGKVVKWRHGIDSYLDGEGDWQEGGGF